MVSWFGFALLSAFLTGLQDYVKKVLLKVDHPFGFVASVYIVYFFLLLPLIFIVQMPPFFLLLLIAVRSCFMVGAMLFLAGALRHIDLSDVAPLSNIRAIFAFLIGILLLNESLRWVSATGVLFIMLGAFAVSYRKGRGISDMKDRFHLYIVGFGLLYAISAALAKVILQQANTIDLLFFHALFSAILFLVSSRFFVTHIRENLKNHLSSYGIIAGLGIGVTYTQYLAFSAGAPVALLTPVLQLSLVIEVVMGGRMLHESHMVQSLVGAALAIIGGVLIAI